MIQIFTLGQPSEKLRDFAAEIFKLPQGDYNLPVKNHPQEALFETLYNLGVRQIIHDGKANEIQCLDGFLYAASTVNKEKIPSQNILVIRP